PGILRIQDDRVQAHPARPWLPLRPRFVAAQPGELLPALPAVAGAEDRGVLDPGIHGVGIGERRFEMPDALELPGVLRAVVPLVRGEGLAGAGARVIDEFVAFAHGHSVGGRGRLAWTCARLPPRLAPIVRALDDLPEPAAGLRRIQPIRVGGRTLDVVDLPAREMRAADIPSFALTVSGQDERALACAHQHSYSAHV